MIKIEPFINAYKQSVIELVLNIQQKEFNIPIQLQDQPDLEDIETFYFKGNGGFWVAVDNNSVLGTIGLIDIGNNEFALRKMFVQENYRGKPYSIASELLQQVIQWCTQKNGSAIYLGTVDKLKAAHRFYEKNGFMLVRPDKLPPSFPRMHVDTIFYQFNLSPGKS